jgi:hypothetical protein
MVCSYGKKIEGKGEIKIESQLYQNQFANNGIMGYTFEAEHPIVEIERNQIIQD